MRRRVHPIFGLARAGGCAIWALALAAPAGRAATVQVIATQDATIYSDSGGNVKANGAGQWFFVGRASSTSGGSTRRALLRFDLSATIPAGSTINSVQLGLVEDRVAMGAAPAALTLRAATASWSEGASVPAGMEGSGATPAAGDVTWLRRVFDTTSWGSPGGDFSAVMSAVTSAGAPGNYTWTSAQMAVDVQGWVNSPATNFGWILIGNEANPMTARRFLARENIATANIPQLTVDYTPPNAAMDWGIYE